MRAHAKATHIAKLHSKSPPHQPKLVNEYVFASAEEP